MEIGWVVAEQSSWRSCGEGNKKRQNKEDKGSSGHDE